jgi:hypothetical protein
LAGAFAALAVLTGAAALAARAVFAGALVAFAGLAWAAALAARAVLVFDRAGDWALARAEALADLTGADALAARVVFVWAAALARVCFLGLTWAWALLAILTLGLAWAGLRAAAFPAAPVRFSAPAAPFAFPLSALALAGSFLLARPGAVLLFWPLPFPALAMGACPLL